VVVQISNIIAPLSLFDHNFFSLQCSIFNFSNFFDIVIFHSFSLVQKVASTNHTYSNVIHYCINIYVAKMATLKTIGITK